MKYLLNFIEQNFKCKFLKLVALVVACTVRMQYYCGNLLLFFLALQSLVNFNLLQNYPSPFPIL